MIAQILTQLRVLFRIAPGVQLDRPESIVQALIGDIEKLRRVAKGDRARIGRNAVPRSADHLVERQSRELRGKIPEGDIDRAERIDRQLLHPVDLPNLPPKMLFQQWILPEQNVPQPPVDQIDHDRSPRRKRLPEHPLIRADRQLRLPGHRRGARQLPPDIRMLDRFSMISVSTAVIFMFPPRIRKYASTTRHGRSEGPMPCDRAQRDNGGAHSHVYDCKNTPNG